MLFSIRPRRRMSNSLLACLMLEAPFVQPIDNRLQRFSRRGQRIFHFRRHLRIDFASDNPVAFKFPKVLGEHLLRYAAQAAAQLTEAAHAGEQLPENQKFPFPADNTECSFRGTIGVFSTACHTYLGVRPLLQSAYFTSSKTWLHCFQ